MAACGGRPWAAVRDAEAEAEARAGWRVAASTAGWLRPALSDFERDEEGEPAETGEEPHRRHCSPPAAARCPPPHAAVCTCVRERD